MNFKAHCLACGDELIYASASTTQECHFCQNTYESSVRCASGHFVCDACHSLPATDMIREYCITTTEKDPLKMALLLMKGDQVNMHGPGHHFLIPAVLLASYYNQKGDSLTKEEKVREAEKRAKNVLGGFCGYYGSCGAGVGTGIFVSLITGSTPLSKKGWRLSNLMTSKSLLCIANHGGPRCCKKHVLGNSRSQRLPEGQLWHPDEHR